MCRIQNISRNMGRSMGKGHTVLLFKLKFASSLLSNIISIFLRFFLADKSVSYVNIKFQIMFSRLYDFRQPSLVIHDPELIKCVFVKNSQDFPTRRVSSPNIGKNRMAFSSL